MKDYNFLLIEKYIKGDLTPEELDSFKILMKNGKNFAKDVALYQEIENSLTSRTINQEEENELKNSLKNLGNEFITKSNKPKVFILKRYGKYLVAASLVIFATVFWLNNENPTYGEFANYENLDMVVRGSSNVKALKAQHAFNTKNYENALKEFNVLLEKDKLNVELKLYKAISLVELDKFKEADAIYLRISLGNSIFKNKAIWYLALSKLKQKDYKACKKALKSLPEDAEDYETAKKLLDKL